MQEIPDMVSLALNITNCQNNCIGCHSSYLKNDIGNQLTKEVLDNLISDNYGVNCVLFMGDGNDINELFELSDYIFKTYNLKTALYTGKNVIDSEYYKHFDFIKIGEYKQECGPLSSKTTNQKLLFVDRINGCIIEDITTKLQGK